MSTPLFNYKTFNVEDVNYEPPKLVRGSSFLAKINDKKRLLFQTPKLLCVNQIEVDNKGCHLELQLTEEHSDFYEFLQKVDENNINYTHAASGDWFQKTFPYDIIDDFYIPTVKHKSTETIPNLNYIKIRIPTHKKEPNINIYDDKRDKIDWKRIQPGTQLIAILELKGLKFLQREVVCDWEIVQLKASIERSKVNLTKILIELSKGDGTNIDNVQIDNNFNNDNECQQENDNGEDGEDDPINDRDERRHLPEDDGEQLLNTCGNRQEENEDENEDEDEDEDNVEVEVVNKISRKPRPQVYNDKVIDKEMVSELAKLPDHTEPEQRNQQNYESSQDSSELTNSDLIINNHHYKIRERRDDLLKVMREADDASKKADLLRSQAEDAAKEIKQMTQSISIDDHLNQSPYY